MSEVAKKHRIEIKVGRKVKLYLVPKSKAKAVESLLEEYSFEENEGISSDKVFKKLDEKYSKQGNILSGLRLRQGLTQVELAKKIKSSQSSIAAIENGDRSIGKTLAIKLAKALKTKPEIFSI